MSGFISMVFAVLTVLSQLAASMSLAEVPDSHETERIIGGTDAEQGMYPWVVALYYNDQFICTASLISAVDVLTAAHCVVFDGNVQAADLYYGIAGNVNRSSPVYRMNFLTVTPHPDYDEQTIRNDIALFKVSEAVPIGDNIQPICLAAPDTNTNKQRAEIMGWGNTNRIRALPATIPEILQRADQRIVPNRVCGLAYPGMVNDMQVCATGLSTGVCNGDSGGPLVLRQDGKPIEIGVTSYINAIIGCGKLLGPAVFTRISEYIDFILQNSDAAGVCVS